MSEGQSALARYASERERLVRDAEPGSEAARALTTLTDEVVAGLTAAALPALLDTAAIFALGGYGAQRLLPASDIDLLVVTDGRANDLEPLVRSVAYPLWDLGLDVGHQVRSRREHLRAVRQDFTILSASLTGRVVAGDTRLGLRVLDEVRAWSHKQRSSLVKRVTAREREGSPYLLEPDLKEGAGGQRDLDELVWLATILAGRPIDSFDDVVATGLIDAGEASRLTSAQEVITSARWRLHLCAPRRPGLMTVDACREADIDTDAVQQAVADVHHTLLDARARLDGDVPDGGTWDAGQLFAFLECGPGALYALERAAWSGGLESIVPGLRPLMTTRRPGLSHRFTVGAHAIRTALAVTDPGDDEFAQAALASIVDRRPLQVAALVHDAGKERLGPGHAERSATLAGQTCRAIGLPSPLTWGVETLAREHLLLSETATHQDLADEDVVLRAAARLGDHSLLGPLYLLTRADMLATGPDVWTPWRATLVRELTAKIDAALSDDIDGAGIVSAAYEVRRAALARATGVGMERSVLAFVEDAPLRYLSSRGPEEVVKHARLIQELRGPLGHGGLVLDVTPGPAPDTWRMTVVTRDREGLFAAIAGVLSLADLDILAAEAFTEAAGLVLDELTVTGASGAHVNHDRWARVERLMRAALSGGLDVESRLAERRRHYPPQAREGVDIRIGPPNPLATIVLVEAPDRVDLLHDLARAIHQLELDIRFVRAVSQSGRVRDVFHLVDAQGEPVTEIYALARRLQEAAER